MFLHFSFNLIKRIAKIMGLIYFLHLTACTESNFSAKKDALFSTKESSYQQILAEQLGNEDGSSRAEEDFGDLPGHLQLENGSGGESRHAIGIELVPGCHAGEFDIISLADYCRFQVPLLVTLKDDRGEHVLVDYGNDGSLSRDQFLDLINQSVDVGQLQAGFAVFVCFDGDQDRQCSDETLVDINEMTDKLMPIAQFLALDMGDGLAANFCATPEVEAIGNQSRAGMTVFHQLFADQNAGNLDFVADLVQGQLGNILENFGPLDWFKNGTPDGAPYDQNDPAVDACVHHQQQPARRVDYKTIGLNLSHFNREICAAPWHRERGCFAAGTRISVSENLQVPVESVRTGHWVALADGRHAQVTEVVAGPEAKPVITFTLATGEILRVTAKHPMLTEAGLKTADQVKITDRFKVASGQWESLREMSQETYTGLVYNFSFAGDQEADHLLIANGVVTGDLELQRSLADETIKEVFLAHITSTLHH